MVDYNEIKIEVYRLINRTLAEIPYDDPAQLVRDLQEELERRYE